MMTFRILIVFLFSALAAGAQNACIQGEVSLLPGREIRLISISDPFAKTEKILDLDSIAADGSFELNTELKDYEALIIAINKYKAPVYVGAGDTLVLNFSSEPKYKLADSWLKGNIDYVFTKTDTNGVNEEISRFDGAYYFFFIQNAQFIGTAQIKQKIEAFESKYTDSSDSHPFIRIYIKYSIAEMKLSNGFNRKEVFDNYLADDSLYISNPGWVSFFENFYADYFDSYDTKYGGAALYNQLNSGISIDSLHTLLNKDQYLSRPDIRQMVLLKSISEAYPSKDFKKKPLRNILEHIHQNPESKQIKVLASNLLARLNKLDAKISLDDIKNKYADDLQIRSDSIPTLLITSLSGGSQLLKEIALLEDLLSRYPDVFNVVELHLGPNRTSRKPDWPMVMIKNNYEYLNEFQIYTIPHFMWFDGSNQLQFNPAAMPSEGLEELIFKIKSNQDQKSKIKVGK